jgi:hypothetical protein
MRISPGSIARYFDYLFGAFTASPVKRSTIAAEISGA